MSAIQLKAISKKFKDGSKEIQALHPVDLEVSAGEFVAIIGPSGSGKSTLLTIMGGLQTPSSGQVFIDGQDFYSLPDKKRSQARFQQIGFILQASNLIPFLKVGQQLELVDRVDPRSAKADGPALLEELGVSDLVDKYPEDLSGGERQRVAIARALYNNPAIILADEPTASLDTQKAYEVVDILSQQAKNHQKAIIMVTHDLRLIESCDRVYQMVDGHLSPYQMNKD
ncbi:ABC transporter ATP-binding protein [Hutsoniella sourekii]|uniref:ABC transporter ATP-binding protein n=1 Tax=Hutsoniella sourekii TaxID=87650 RepID=UPI0004836754|nr:ABC transporter ATP-binding protein [Hutsoniella sourekii]